MADTSLPNLTELNATPADADELYIVDKSDTTDGATGTNKKITRTNLVGGLQAQPAEGAFADGDKTKLDGIEASADVTDATNVASAGAVMADGSGNDITGDIVFTEKADHSSTPGAGKGYLWTKNTAPSTLIFTDDTGADTTVGASGGGISAVVEDTTPQLGGQLDVNGNAIGDGTNELLTFTEDASAVNHVNIENEATGSGPVVRAAGDDANIDLNLQPKATGNVTVSDGTDTTKKVSFEVSGATTGTATTIATSQTAARTITLPDATDTLVGKATTDTLTNKTFDANGTGNSLSNVDVADLANGTDGELITWDAAGAPTTVAVGTSGHVLTSNGAGAAPTFQAAAGGSSTDWHTVASFRLGDTGDNNGIEFISGGTGSADPAYSSGQWRMTPSSSFATDALSGCRVNCSAISNAGFLTWGDKWRITADFRTLNYASNNIECFFGLFNHDVQDQTDTPLTKTIRHAGFFIQSAGAATPTLNASNANNTTQTVTDVSSGVTWTQYNKLEMIYDGGTDVKFYVNGSLAATHTTNLPTGTPTQQYMYGWASNVGAVGGGAFAMDTTGFSLQVPVNE